MRYRVINLLTHLRLSHCVVVILNIAEFVFHVSQLRTEK